MSQFYRRYSPHLIVVCLLALPWLVLEGESLPSNNDIETWLPRRSAVRQQYEEFKDLFGAEEVILLGLPTGRVDAALADSLALRIEALPGIRQCWSPAQFRRVMTQLGVSEELADQRLRGLALSHDQQLLGVVALLSKEGIADRSETVAAIRSVLAYCQLQEEDVLLTGAPVVVAELNRLGSIEANRPLFILAQLICLVLLYCSTRDWRLAGSILLITVLAIELTNCAVKLAGGEMNFILTALPVMVMVFTMATAVHFLNYYRSMAGHADPLGAALRRAWKPCGLAMMTTAIGLLSLLVSDIGPVRQFGLAGAVGALIAFVCGLGLTPVLLVLWPESLRSQPRPGDGWAVRCSHQIIRRKTPIAAAGLLLLAITAGGLLRLQARIDPLDFLPRGSRVVADLLRVEQDLTNVESIEAVVDFGTEDLSFVEKLNRVRDLERRIAGHSGIRHTMSLASFFPNEMPFRPLEATRLLARAQGSHNSGEFLSPEQRFWRISARISGSGAEEKERMFRELNELLAGEPIRLTGIAPLLEQAQRDIFQGFWESFAMAFGVITLVMALALRSLKTALIAMLPNLTPICIVFGLLGWLGAPVDIGMMMTASIALGIAVDGTFHMLVSYQNFLALDSAPTLTANPRRPQGMRRERAAWSALMETGAPVLQAAVIAGIGILALTQSSFAPTVRFGWLLSALLLVAVLGDLILLPALLAWRVRRPRNRVVPQKLVRMPHERRLRDAA